MKHYVLDVMYKQNVFKKIVFFFHKYDDVPLTTIQTAIMEDAIVFQNSV